MNGTEVHWNDLLVKFIVQTVFTQVNEVGALENPLFLLKNGGMK